MGGDGQGTTREAQRACEVGREGAQDSREARAVCVNAAARGAEDCGVGVGHGQTWRKSIGIG